MQCSIISKLLSKGTEMHWTFWWTSFRNTGTIGLKIYGCFDWIWHLDHVGDQHFSSGNRHLMKTLLCDGKKLFWGHLMYKLLIWGRHERARKI